VRLFTRDYGKLTMRAISAKKATAKLAGHIEPFLYTDLFIANSKTIDIIAGSNTITAHARLRQSLLHNTLASFFVEVVDRFTEEREPDPELFDFVHDFLSWLNDTDQPNALSAYAAILQLFGLLGYHIELFMCHQCHQPIRAALENESSRFSFKMWNVECASCRTEDEAATLSDEAIKVLRYMLSERYHGAARLQLSRVEWEEVDQFVRALLRYHANTDLKSETVLLSILASLASN